MIVFRDKSVLNKFLFWMYVSISVHHVDFYAFMEHGVSVSSLALY